MGDTFQSLGVTLLALLPGALYTWAFERQAGAWGVGFSDRLLRFVGASAIFHVLFAAATYQAYRRLIVEHQLSEGRPLPWWTWLIVLGYVAIPILAGSLVGNAARARKPWATAFTGPAPAPRAYDFLFSTAELSGWVRIRMKNDAGWVRGAWGTETSGLLASYASGYPQPEEIFLVDTAEADEDGDFLLDDKGDVQFRGVGALVRLDEAAYLEFIDD